jgi:hypothetical protein
MYSPEPDDERGACPARTVVEQDHTTKAPAANREAVDVSVIR